MQIFRLGALPYIVYASSIALALLWISFFKGVLSTTLLSLCIAVATLGLIDTVTTNLVYQKDILLKTGLFKRETIKLDEVRRIELLPNSKGKKVFVGIYTDEKKIFVTFWYREYKTLLRLILEYCKTRPGVEIDPKLLETVQES